MGTAAGAAAGIMIVPRHVLGGTGFQAPSDTVNVAIVGYKHGMGTSNLLNVAQSDNLVALCDCRESDGGSPGMKRGVGDVPRAARRRSRPQAVPAAPRTGREEDETD